MRNPGKAASGSGSGDDPGSGCPPVADRHPAGLPDGAGLRFSPAPGTAAPVALRPAVFPGSRMDLAVSQLCRLPGRHPHGLLIRHDVRRFSLGKDRGAVSDTGIFRILEDSGAAFPDFPVSFEKNFGICKNFVCIWGKMGYNSMYQNFELTKKAEKGIPWQKKEPRPKM